MNRVQKMSWSFVISIPLAMILGIVAFVVHHFGLDSPRPFVFSAVGVMGVAVFLTFFIFKKDKGKTLPSADHSSWSRTWCLKTRNPVFEMVRY